MSAPAPAPAPAPAGDPRAEALALIARKRRRAFLAPAVALLYLLAVAWAFDAPGLLARADGENARTLLRDAWSHKVHVTRDNRTGEVSVAVEGQRNGAYPPGEAPPWVSLGETTVIALGDGHVVRFGPGGGVRYDIPGYGLVAADPGAGGAGVTLPGGEVPPWINASGNRVAIETEAGRLTITRGRTEVFRRFPGWELFFFTLDSPYHGLSWAEIGRAAAGGEAGAILGDVWSNPLWRHKDVAWALGETVLMAFLGTFGGALLAMPLAVLAARGLSPLAPVRLGVRRVFDLLRGVDALVWTIVLGCAYGPGPLTGALAILLTDGGTFGKMFSEALENVDGRQVEGVRSTGAGPVARVRHGVIPQVAPIWLSQMLYSFESSVRGATVIGAITGGGIGLLLTQPITTQQDWEKVTYYIALILLMVFAMDTLSGRLRRWIVAGP